MISFCANLEKEHLFLGQRRLKKNDVLHHARDKFTHLYVVKQGSLKALVCNYQGLERIQYLYLKNEVYGFDGIYNAVYPYETRALCATVICEMPYRSFLKLINRHPQLLEQSLKLMSQQLASTQYLQLHSAQQKVAAFLLDLSKRLDTKDNELLKLPMAYQDIAYYLNLAPETISRVLAQFKKSKIINTSKKMIQFLNLNQLREITT